MTTNTLPQLRWPLDIQYIEQEGRTFAVVRDPLGISNDTALVPAPLMPIISRFDGKHSIERIVAEGASFGVTEALVKSIIEQLDGYLLLENAKFRDHRKTVESDFRKQEFREPVHAGLVYPDDPMLLQNEILRFRDRAEQVAVPSKEREMIGYIAPHIDYERGWRTYGAGYRVLEKIPRPDLIFLLGTAHQATEGYYHLTTKRFRTPLGAIPTEEEIVNEIARAAGTEKMFKHELLHRREHSLELQLPFLSSRFGKDAPAIVPILVGSFHAFLQTGRAPIETSEIQDFVGVLAAITKRYRLGGQRVWFYGGVDLAHVGTHFGDRERMDDRGIAEVERRDRELLDSILTGSEERLFAHMAEDCDQRRICGFPSIYTMLAALRCAGVTVKGTLIEYRQAMNRQNDCTVTFASAYWNIA